MYYDFLVFALLGGFGAAEVGGPLGVVVVCRRMSYLADSLAHSTVHQECHY